MRPLQPIPAPSYRADAVAWAADLADAYGESATFAATGMLRLARYSGLIDHIAMCEQIVAILEASNDPVRFTIL